MNMEGLNVEKFKITGIDSLKDEAIKRPNITYWKDAWRRLKKNYLAMFSLYFLIFVVIMVVIGPYLSGKDFFTIVGENKNLSPSSEFWFGTDGLGRDLFSRIWLAGRASIIIALFATVVQIVIGCLYGGIMAYFGGIVDEIMMRIIEIINSIPQLLIVMLIIVVLGNSLVPFLIALCLTAWTGTARMVRGQIMQLRESEYVMAAQVLGASPLRIILKHLIPNTLGFIILNASTSIPMYIFEEASLSFLGLGLQPPHTTWGQLISLGQQSFEFYPYQLLFPAVLLCLTVLAFNLLGDGLRDALDPNLRK